MEIQLVSENIVEFLHRFYNGYDGVIKSVKIEFVFERKGRQYTSPMIEIFVDIPDRELDSDFYVIGTRCFFSIGPENLSTMPAACLGTDNIDTPINLILDYEAL